jgi:hypothetical protein
MILSLVKRPAAAGQLSRIGDYLLLQHEGLDSGDDLTDAAQYERHRRHMGIAFPRSGTMTRSPPHPLFHRRRRQSLYPGSNVRCFPQGKVFLPVTTPHSPNHDQTRMDA